MPHRPGFRIARMFDKTITTATVVGEFKNVLGPSTKDPVVVRGCPSLYPRKIQQACRLVI